MAGFEPSTISNGPDSASSSADGLTRSSLTSLLGRDAEIAQVVALLDAGQTRLLTLTGPGGVGKTRLAREVMSHVEGDYADGAVFVPLAPIESSGLVPGAVARACGIPERGGSSEDSLIAALRNRHLLLVLDNFEHLLQTAPTWPVDTLGACPRLKLLVTSRIALNIHGEQRFVVAPLETPDGNASETPGATASEQLFAQRARAIRPDFALSAGNGNAVAELCRRLDGLPLAIELAAARINILTPAEMLARLTDRPGLLAGGPRDAPPRQRSMRDAVAWSYDLLSHDEQRLFRQITVFAGGFTLEAAEAVCDVLLASLLDTLSGIASLVDKSLLQPVQIDHSPTRYRMLETIREFGAEQLRLNGEDVDARDRHAAWCLSLKEHATSLFDPTTQLERIDRIDQEHANLRAALDWLDTSDRNVDLARLVTVLRWHWQFSGYWVEGLAWYERVIARRNVLDPKVYSDAVRWAGQLAQVLENPKAHSYLEEALTLAELVGSRIRQAEANYFLGCLHEDRGDYEFAEGRFMLARELWRQESEEILVISSDYHLGIVAYGKGDLTMAVVLLEVAKREAEALGNTIVPTWSALYLGLIACDRGDIERAANLLRAHPADMNPAFHHHLSDMLALAGVFAHAVGNLEAAARFFAAAASKRQGFRASLPERISYERAETSTRRKMGSDAYMEAWERGRRMRLDQINAEFERLLADDATSASPPLPGAASVSPLSSRELDVLRLLADGKSNREIADALYISPRTAAHHVANILAKLDLSSRTSAVAYAVRHGLA